MPKFSVIIQSYLGHYQGAASNREEKIIRAVNSVINQTFKDFEIIIVADGCDKTFDIIFGNYGSHDMIDCLLIKKQPQWSGGARNFGLHKAVGDYIVYLDIDDYWGPNHLQIINDQLANHDWVWFDDYVMNRDMKPYKRDCFIKQKFQNGTSNICHKKSLGVQWTGAGYGMDDWSLTQALLPHPNHTKISIPEYYVCHLPSKLDV